MNPTRVYLLVERMLNGMAVHGVFSSEEKAEEYANAYNAKLPWYQGAEFVIREHALDPVGRG